MAENNKQLEEAKRLLQEINTLRAKLNQTPLVYTDGEAVKNIQSLRNELKGVQNSFEDTADSATSLYDQVRAISSEFNKQPDALQKIRGSMKKITSIAEDLKMNEQGIKDLSTKNLDDLTEKLKLNKKILEDETRSILNSTDLSKTAQEDLEIIKEYVDIVKKGGKLEEDQLDRALQTLQNSKDLTEEQKASLALYLDQGNALTALEGKINDVKEEQKKVNKLMGVGGAVIDAADSAMSKLGMNSNLFKDAVSEAKDNMQKTAKAIATGAQQGGRLSVLMAGLGPLASGFASALFDPLTIMLKIVDAFFKVDKAGAKFQQQTGMNADALAGANSELATSVDFLETASELSAQIGTNAVVALGPDLIAAAAGLKNELGLSAENAGMLAVNAKLSGNTMAGLEAQVQASTEAFNNTNDAAISSAQVIRDMHKSSKATQAQFAQYPGKLASAAAAARRIGMELKDMDGVMDNLLDFQSSIEAEMEAELLTGKQLNLNKARELALQNDIEGVSNEIFKNSADISEYAKMNRYEQEAYAKALGMSRDQLGEMAIQKGIQAGMTEKEKAAIRGVTLEESKRMDIQENLQKSLDKLAQAMTPMLEILVPIAETFGTILGYIAKPIGMLMSWADSLKEIGGGFGTILSMVTKLAIGGGILLIAKSLKDAFNPDVAGGLFTNLKKNFGGIGKMASGLKDKILGGGGDKASEVTKDAQGRFRDAKGRFAKGPGKAEDAVKGGADKSVEAANSASEAEDPKSNGEKLKEFFTNLAAGLKEMASMQVVGGALALIPASIGLVAFIPGYLGAKLVERLDGEKVKTGLIGLATGLKEMADMSVVGGAGALVVASLGLVGFIPGYVGARLIQNLDGEKLQTGLSGLASGLTSMGTGSVLLGAGALVIAAGAFILSIVGIPGMIAIGSLGSSTSTGLTALATGLQSMSSTFAGVAAVALTAGAFILMLGAIPGMLFVALTGSMVAAGLTGLATGLTAFGTAAANPLLWLGIAALGAFGIAMIPLSFAIGLLAPAIEAFGTVITSVFNGIATLVGAVAAGFVTLMDSVTLEKVMNMALLGPALLGAAVGLTAFSAAMAAGSIAGGVASFLTGGGLLADLQTLVDMATPLQSVAGSLTAIAAALGGIGLALATMETEKLEEMQDLITTAAFAAPAMAAVGAIGDFISGITGGGEEGSAKGESNDKLIAKIDELIVAVKQGKNINMDGRRVGTTLQAAATNT
jgi:hypothetical protein